MIRKTYVEIDGQILEENILNIKKKYPDYKYYIGVVKNNAYHHGIKCVHDLIRGGVNYLAVSSLEEALKIRHYEQKIPILCLEPIEIEYIYDAINENITITVDNLDYLKSLLNLKINYDLKIHLALDTGMHRLGFTTKEDLSIAYSLLKERPHFCLEGIYSHFATSGVMDSYYDLQVKKFLELTKDINLSEIPIVHMGRSLSLVQHEKLSFCNGIRLGIVMYGFNQSMAIDNSLKGKIRAFKRRQIQKKLSCSKTILTNDLHVKPAMRFYTSIISKRRVIPNDYVGYGAKYKIKEEGYIYTLAVGYADGVNKDFKTVVIEKEFCPIIADCMDMILVYSKKEYELGCKVEIFGEEKNIKEVLKTTNQNAYHLFNQISNRVIRVHKNKNDEEQITY